MREESQGDNNLISDGMNMNMNKHNYNPCSPPPQTHHRSRSPTVRVWPRSQDCAACFKAHDLLLPHSPRKQRGTQRPSFKNGAFPCELPAAHHPSRIQFSAPSACICISLRMDKGRSIDSGRCRNLSSFLIGRFVAQPTF